MRLDLSINAMHNAYESTRLTPIQLVDQLHAQMLAEDAALDRHLWIRLRISAIVDAHFSLIVDELGRRDGAR